MDYDLDQSLDLLRRMPAALDALLRGTSPAWHAANEGAETWSPFDVVGHLVHGEETDWVPRARIILEHGPSRPFDPYDRFAQFERFAGWPLERLLDRFAELRRENVATVAAWQLTEAQLDLPGQHPALGPVTLRQLLATWVAHDLGHLAQIARVMAKQVGDEVGAWRQYLRILGS